MASFLARGACLASVDWVSRGTKRIVRYPQTRQCSTENLKTQAHGIIQGMKLFEVLNGTAKVFLKREMSIARRMCTLDTGEKAGRQK